jgi:hypothetical protein
VDGKAKLKPAILALGRRGGHGEADDDDGIEACRVDPANDGRILIDLRPSLGAKRRWGCVIC